MTEEQTIEQMEMELIAEECRITTEDLVEYPNCFKFRRKNNINKRWRFKDTNTDWNLW